MQTPQHSGGKILTKLGNAPVAGSAGSRNGGWIDRETGQGLAESCTVALLVGATAGGPTSFTVDVKVQSADDASGTNSGDYTEPKTNVVAGTATETWAGGAAPTAVASTATTANSLTELDVNLIGARRFIRIVETIAFVGGASPTVLAGEAVILGGSPLEPV